MEVIVNSRRDALSALDETSKALANTKEQLRVLDEQSSKYGDEYAQRDVINQEKLAALEVVFYIYTWLLVVCVCACACGYTCVHVCGCFREIKLCVLDGINKRT